MATVNGVIQFTGKLGDVVGSRGQGGKNYMRVRKRKIKNPRTDKQNIQRMILATVGASIAYLAEVLRTSVEGKQAGAQTLAYLRSVWMKQLRTANILSGNELNYLSKGENRFAPNPYMLSKGQLGSYSVTEIATNAPEFKIAGMPAAFDATLTASQLFPNVTLGDQITIICVGDESDGGASSHVDYCRFAFKTNDLPALVSAGDEGFTLNPAAIDLTKAAGAYDQLVFTAGGSISTYTDSHEFLIGDLVAAGIIVSNLENNRRSNSWLFVAESYRGKWNAAIDAYPTYGDTGVEIDMASDVYLNNSTTPVGEAAAAPAIVSVVSGGATIRANSAGNYQIDGLAQGDTIVVTLGRPVSSATTNNALLSAAVSGSTVTLTATSAPSEEELTFVNLSVEGQYLATFLV